MPEKESRGASAKRGGALHAVVHSFHTVLTPSLPLPTAVRKAAWFGSAVPLRLNPLPLCVSGSGLDRRTAWHCWVQGMDGFLCPGLLVCSGNDKYMRYCKCMQPFQSEAVVYSEKNFATYADSIGKIPTCVPSPN